MNVNFFPADVFSEGFSLLAISDLKTVLHISRRWNFIANQDILWQKIAQRFPIPTKISDRHIIDYPEWQVYNESGKAKEKVKQFLLTSRSVFLYVTNEKLRYEYSGRPFKYGLHRDGGGMIFYPDYLGPKEFSLWTFLILDSKSPEHVAEWRRMEEQFSAYGRRFRPYPFGPRENPIIPICMHDKLGQDIKYVPNTCQYFYLLNKKEGEQLYWICNKIFYRITCTQQSTHSNFERTTV